ncbi:MAG: cupin [Xanthobacteraceae bacterium]
MTVLEGVSKRRPPKIANRSRPSPEAPAELLRKRKPASFRFKDDGLVPNNPKWPLLLYRSAVRFPEKCEPASILEDLFAKNGWRHSWRDGIYPYLHYHSRIHEVLGIARGRAKVQFGGPHGRLFELKAGDVAILPAGTGHQRFWASVDFLAVGAYPPTGTYDECTSPEQYRRALAAVPLVVRPRTDPLYGGDGPLLAAWPTGRQLSRRKQF